MRCPANDQDFFFHAACRTRGLCERSQALRHDFCRQRIQFGTSRFNVGKNLDSRIVERATTEPGVQVIGCLREGGDGQALRNFDDPILDLTIQRNNDHEGAPGTNRHEFDVFQHSILLGGDHKAGTVRQAGKHHSGFREHFLNAPSGPRNACFYDPSLLP